MVEIAIIMSKTTNPYACSVCNESFSNSVDLVKHVQTYHTARKLQETKHEIESNNRNKQESSSFVKYKDEKLTLKKKAAARKNYPSNTTPLLQVSVCSQDC